MTRQKTGRGKRCEAVAKKTGQQCRKPVACLGGRGLKTYKPYRFCNYHMRQETMANQKEWFDKKLKKKRPWLLNPGEMREIRAKIFGKLPQELADNDTWQFFSLVWQVTNRRQRIARDMLALRQAWPTDADEWHAAIGALCVVIGVSREHVAAWRRGDPLGLPRENVSFANRDKPGVCL